MLVLPRFTIENYFIAPKEIWPSIPAGKKDSFAGDFAGFEAEIVVIVGPWLRHGALWSTVTPLWEGLRNKGFKDSPLIVRHIGQISQKELRKRLVEGLTLPDELTRLFRERLVR